MFEFLRKISVNQDLVEYFDNIRKKRNDFIYRDVESIDKSECEEIINKADEFIQEIKKFIEKHQ